MKVYWWFSVPLTNSTGGFFGSFSTAGCLATRTKCVSLTMATPHSPYLQRCVYHHNSLFRGTFYTVFEDLYQKGWCLLQVTTRLLFHGKKDWKQKKFDLTSRKLMDNPRLLCFNWGQLINTAWGHHPTTTQPFTSTWSAHYHCLLVTLALSPSSAARSIQALWEPLFKTGKNSSKDTIISCEQVNYIPADETTRQSPIAVETRSQSFQGVPIHFCIFK